MKLILKWLLSAGAALAVGGQAAVIQQQLNFSRDMEREADRIGYGILTQAGFAPEGFVGMFEKLQGASRINDNGDWPYLRSHPLTTQRIADMQQRQQQLARPTPSVDLEALLVAARARVLGRPGVDVLRAWASEPESPSFDRLPLARRAGVLYAAALAQAQLRDLPRAQALATRLAQEVSADARALRQARLLQAELALLTIPITLVTLGLFLFVINALMFWSASGLLSGFHVNGFWAALIGSLIYSALGLVIDGVLERI